MSRDRLAAFRHQQQAQQGHEMTNIGAPSTQADSNGSADAMTNFYNQVTAVQDSIAEFSSNVSRIADLHSRALNSADDTASRQNAALVDDLVGQTRELSSGIKDKIQALSSFPAARPQDQAIRKNQTLLLRQKFVEVLQNYQNVERDYRQRYRQRVERQFKIVKPEATPEEVEAVVNDTEGSGAQIFTQALSTSTRYNEGRIAYRDVQDRHHDIQKIERTLEELASMFNDVSVLIVQQDEGIDTIQATAIDVEANTRAGLQQTEKAVEHARSARRKRWYCFGLFVFVIVVLAIVLGVVLGTHH